MQNGPLSETPEERIQGVKNGEKFLKQYSIPCGDSERHVTLFKEDADSGTDSDGLVVVCVKPSGELLYGSRETKFDGVNVSEILRKIGIFRDKISGNVYSTLRPGEYVQKVLDKKHTYTHEASELFEVPDLRKDLDFEKKTKGLFFRQTKKAFKKSFSYFFQKGGNFCKNSLGQRKIFTKS